MKYVVFVLLPLLVLSACPRTEYVPPPIPPPDTDLCDEACAHLEELGCEEGEPVYDDSRPGPKGVPNLSCADWCRDLQKKGYAFNPRCLRIVPDCLLVDDYQMKDPKECQATPDTTSRSE